MVFVKKGDLKSLKTKYFEIYVIDRTNISLELQGFCYLSLNSF